MYVVMALFDSELRDEIFMLMELNQIKNYTHFTGLHGSSAHGKKEGTVAWPGANEIMLLLLNDEDKERFSMALKKYKAERQPSPGLLMFSWPVTEMV